MPNVEACYMKILGMYKVFHYEGKKNKRRKVSKPPSVDQHDVGFFDGAVSLESMVVECF